MLKHSFTVVYPDRMLELRVPVYVQRIDGDKRNAQYAALWDTGCTLSCISSKVVKDLGLIPFKDAELTSATDVTRVNLYSVDIFLPNDIPFVEVPAKEVNLPLEGVDVIIGMDIIGCGDSVISRHDGKTVLTYRAPSQGAYDFSGENAFGAGRNDSCPCGSDRKYKECCGKP